MASNELHSSCGGGSSDGDGSIEWYVSMMWPIANALRLSRERKENGEKNKKKRTQRPRALQRNTNCAIIKAKKKHVRFRLTNRNASVD